MRCIKLWAKNRGIHSNVLGYLGGVAWAILVAKICKDFPEASPNQILAKFFQFYRDYPWGYDHPVTLGEILNDKNIVSFAIPDELIYIPDRVEKMPIITPAFPSMNTTYAVGETQKNVLLTELTKAAMVTEELYMNPHTTKIRWNRLFKKFPFFKAYEHFMEI